MRKLAAAVAAATMVAGLGLAAPGAGATTGSYCGITWGSLTKTGGALATSDLTGVRAGRHDCYDRLVFDLNGKDSGFDVSYVSTVYDQAGAAIPLRGGAFLQINLYNAAYDDTGASTYNPTKPAELANVTGWDTFRQVSWGGSFEGYTTVGLGVRARLPFRVFTLDGPGSGSRVVVDVAHKW